MQFMLNNLVGIPPMLAIAGLADLIGIAQVLLGVSLVIVGVLLVTILMQRRIARAAALPVAASAVATSNEATTNDSAISVAPVVKTETKPAHEPARVTRDKVSAVE